MVVVVVVVVVTLLFPTILEWSRNLLK
jgi:hypothetical protein